MVITFPDDVRVKHISPGGYHVSTQGKVMQTLLGSCIATCLFDRENNVFGMNHFLLAENPHNDDIALGDARAGLFGEHSMQKTINKMVNLGAQPENIKAKIFGGSSVISIRGSDKDFLFEIGQNNIKFTKQFLKENKIEILANDTGSKLTRVIYFDTRDCSVIVKKYLKKQAEYPAFALPDMTRYCMSCSQEKPCREFNCGYNSELQNFNEAIIN